jgi:hypothetical protein
MIHVLTSIVLFVSVLSGRLLIYLRILFHSIGQHVISKDNPVCPIANTALRAHASADIVRSSSVA